MKINLVKFSHTFIFHIVELFFDASRYKKRFFRWKKKSFRNTKIWIRLRAFHLQKVYLTPPTTMVWEMGEVNRVNIVGVRNISMCYVNGTWMNGNSDWILFGGCFDYVISRHFSARLRLEESEPIVWKNFFLYNVCCCFLLVSCVKTKREKEKWKWIINMGENWNRGKLGFRLFWHRCWALIPFFISMWILRYFSSFS